MPELRFVHAADLHLDSPFVGIRSEAPELVTQTLHRATFAAYENIISLCIREQVDALLIAGDVYDGADRSLRAQLKVRRGAAATGRSRSSILHLPRQPRPAGRLGGTVATTDRVRSLRLGGDSCAGVS